MGVRGRAGHWWIKVRVGLAGEKKVQAMAAALRVHPNLIVGCCVDFWGQAKRNAEEIAGAEAAEGHWRISKDGNAATARAFCIKVLDGLVELEGFAEAMEQIGWLRIDGGSVVIPEFDRYLSVGVDARAAAAARKRRQRANPKEGMSHACPGGQAEVTRDSAGQPAHVARDSAGQVRDIIRESLEKEENTEEATVVASCSEPAFAGSEPQEKTAKNKRKTKPKISEEELDQTDPRLLTFPVRGDPDKTEWHLRASKADEYRLAFPDLDILAVARKALVWLRNNPARTKTAGGMGKFLFGFLTRAQNDYRGPPGGGGFGAAKPKEATDSRAILEQVERKMRDAATRPADGPAEAKLPFNPAGADDCGF